MASNHLSMCTPKVSVITIEDTILETPIPQATSTVNWRNSSISPSKVVEVPEEDPPNSSRLVNAVGDIHELIHYSKKHDDSVCSTSSSFGLLHTSFSDFSVVDEEMKSIDEIVSKLRLSDVPGSASDEPGLNASFRSTAGTSFDEADLQLRMQRALAEQVLERTSDKLDDSNEVKSAPLPNPNYSSVDQLLSDWSFRQNRISAHSTDISDEEEDAANPFSNSEIAANEDLKEMFSVSTEFTSADKVENRLAADEASWKKAFGNLALTPPDGQRMEISGFSGIVGEAEISIGSSILGPDSIGKKKVCADEFFSLKTDRIGSLQRNKSGEMNRPNFGNSICSPVSNRKRIPLVDLTANTTINIEDPSIIIDSVHPVPARVSQGSGTASQEEEIHSTTSSIPSITRINNIMADGVDSSPRTVIRNLLQYRKPMDKVLKDSSNIKVKEDLEPSKPQDDDKVKFRRCHRSLPICSVDDYDGDDSSVSIQDSYISSNWGSVSCFVIDQSDDDDDTKENEHDRLNRRNRLSGPPLRNHPPNLELISKIPKLINVRNKSPKQMKAKVTVLVNNAKTDDINLGILPEVCIKTSQVTIVNHSDWEIPLLITVKEGSPCFFLNGHQSDERVTSLTCTLSQTVNIQLALQTPNLSEMGTGADFADILGLLVIEEGVTDETRHVLQSLPLRACVGKTVLMLTHDSPVVLQSPGLGKPVSQKLPLKNAGVVPMHIFLMIVNGRTLEVDKGGVLSLDKLEVKMNPGEVSEVQVTFNPELMLQENLERLLVLELQPNGLMYQLVLKCVSHHAAKNEWKELNKLPNRRSSASSGSDSHNSSKASDSVGNMSKVGKPMMTTKKQLIWSCLAVGKSHTESFTVRNERPGPIKVQMNVIDSTNAYKLLSERGEYVNERKINLHSRECLTCTVMFCPVRPGAAFARIIFRELSNHAVQDRLSIPLCGYGGSSKVVIRDVSKDKSGHKWLNLGALDTSMVTQFTISNKGNLPAFALIKPMVKGVNSAMQSTIIIEPSQVVIGPGFSTTVMVDYSMEADDVNYLAQGDLEVREVGTLNVVCGDEPTRQRIRRIKNMEPKCHNDKLKRQFNAIDAESLCAVFSDETIIEDVSSLLDLENSVSSLYRSLQQHEIALIAERIEDRTMVAHSGCESGGATETSMLFQTLCSDNATFVCPSETGRSSDGNRAWTVFPSSLTLMLPKLCAGCITITSNFNKNQQFEVQTADPFLTVNPVSDIIRSGGEVVVIVSCSMPLSTYKGQTSKSLVKIFMENDVKTVSIIIHNSVGKTEPHLVNIPKLTSSTKVPETPAPRPKSVEGPKQRARQLWR